MTEFDFCVLPSFHILYFRILRVGGKVNVLDASNYVFSQFCCFSESNNSVYMQPVEVSFYVCSS